MIVQLPDRNSRQFNSYQVNGQSALLQDIKNKLQETYSVSHLKGDGQVIGIAFSD